MVNVQCLCGDIELHLSGEPVVQLYCHCDDCQLVHGAGYVPTAVYRTDDVRIVRGEPSAFRLVVTPRYSCQNCGTRLFTQGSAALRAVNAYLLPAGTFRPALHIYCKFARLPVIDPLPHYSTVPERWGGSEEVLTWRAPSAEEARP